MAKIEKIAFFARQWAAPVGIAFLFLLIIGSLFLPKNSLQQAKEKLLDNPNDFESYLIIAEEFIDNNQFVEAEHVLQLAQSIQTNNQNLEKLWQKKYYSDPQDIRRLINAWKKVANEKPDCRDCYFQLAILHTKLYQDEKAREYLSCVLDLDPNFEPAKKLEKILKN